MQAQPAPENGDVATLLVSPEISRVAWGAYLAGQRQEARYVPLIVPLLKHQNKDVQLAAVDALIQLHADVPDAMLSSFNSDTLDGAIVLIARDPRAHTGFLLQLLDRPLGNEQWAAVQGLLAATPPPGYSARLLREWEPEIDVKVWEKTEGIGCGGRGILVMRPARDRTGFPPLVVYVLSLGSVDGGEVPLVGGPLPVTYRRTSEERASRGVLDLQAARGTILYYLAGREKPSWFGSFPWTGELKYREDVGSVLEQYRKSLDQLRRTLRERGLLTEQEAKIEPKHRLVIEDQRVDRKIPLPAVEGGE
jgi:hypothetical protein